MLIATPISNPLFFTPYHPPTQVAMLRGKNLTLVFLGLGGWKFHQMAVFANRSKTIVSDQLFCPLPPNPLKVAILDGKNLNLLFLGLGGWKFPPDGYFNSRSKKKFQIDIFVPYHLTHHCTLIQNQTVSFRKSKNQNRYIVKLH